MLLLSSAAAAAAAAAAGCFIGLLLLLILRLRVMLFLASLLGLLLRPGLSFRERQGLHSLGSLVGSHCSVLADRGSP
jgi:hypothetical protein